MPLNPQIAALIEASADLPRLSELSPEEARERANRAKAVVKPGPDVAELREVEIPLLDRTLGARVYIPHGDPAGVYVYLHGGGWTIGAVEHYDTMCQIVAVEAQAIVVNVDYRLAPEHQFPLAIEDAFAGAKWAADEFTGLPLAIGGDSSGGNLAAAVTQLARERGGPRIDFQVLVYPVCDHDFETPSYQEYGDAGLLVGRAEMELFWNNYVPDEQLRDDVRASPLRATDLSGLPPAFVLIAEYDPLRDEGLRYAERLSEAGVPVDLRHWDDVAHGFATLATVIDRADEAMLEISAVLAAAFAPDT